MLLIRHKRLEVLRTAKIISKKEQNADRLMQEANLIKNLKHPGIPLIYDIEEDSNSICIIEEYISGKSLSEYVKQSKSLQPDIIFHLLIEICKILEYIHGFGEYGIIHLDLKPEHIMIDELKQVWLIDFDNAVNGDQKKGQCEGTVFYAAPEQYHRLELDQRADIYSLGMLLLYMFNEKNVQSGVDGIRQHMLYPIIKKCMHHNPAERYQQVSDVRREMEMLQEKYLKQKRNGSEHSIVIRIKGARHGIGATHLCLSMAKCFRKQGLSVLCVDASYNQHLFLASGEGKPQSNGIYECHGISILPDYHGRVVCKPEAYQVIIVDEGAYKKPCQSEKIWKERCISGQYEVICVLVVDGKYGAENEQKLFARENQRNVIFVNHMNGMQFYRYCRNLKEKVTCYAIPCIYQWNRPGRLFEENIQRWIEEFAPEVLITDHKNGMREVCVETKKILHWFHKK